MLSEDCRVSETIQLSVICESSVDVVRSAREHWERRHLLLNISKCLTYGIFFFFFNFKSFVTMVSYFSLTWL